ncbi:MAG: ATP-binding protein, partial [Oscillospiraceae bacterium]|nr:ATP-binding protein [Oscillospiraceae bacterium]
MNIINRLPQHVADLIAAGEVVERPASVVKELFENSADAGAKSVAVEIKRGGMSYIRVTDDGRGMSPQDAETAFLRHATSKLKDEYGLEAIGTLGFRGEALAAISAVSRIRLFTRERGSEEGSSLALEAGQLISAEQAGCPEGSTMIVEDLFYNTPARMKYMKKDQAEGAAVTTAMIRLALSRPDISVSYIKDGEEVFHTPGDGKELSAVYAD